MKNLLLILPTLFLISCASTSTVNFSKTHHYTKKAGEVLDFEETHEYLLTNIAKAEIPYAKNNKLILKSNVKCNIFRQFGDGNRYNLKFILIADFKDKNITKYTFKGLTITNESGKAVGWSYNQISSPEKLEESKACTKQIINLFRK